MTNLFPPAKSILVANLKSPDLIVARLKDVQCFAIRSYYGNEDTQEPVYLMLGPNFPEGVDEPCLKDHLTGDSVLSYGSDYRFDIDVSPENVLFADAADYTSGVIISGDLCYFRFKIEPLERASRMGIIDLDSGAAIERLPDGPSALMKKWGISVGLQGKDDPVAVIPIR